MPAGVKWSREQLEALPGLSLHDMMIMPLDRLRLFFDRVSASGHASLAAGEASLVAGLLSTLGEAPAGDGLGSSYGGGTPKSSPSPSPAEAVVGSAQAAAQAPAKAATTTATEKAPDARSTTRSASERGAGDDFGVPPPHEEPAPRSDADRTAEKPQRPQYRAQQKAQAQNKKPCNCCWKKSPPRLKYLCDVGIGYLTLDRQSRTLSGGEVQRINLTTALGTSLVNTLFVLDEPSIGLHPRDMHRITLAMHRLRDAGNTLVVVEHDPAVMMAADRMIDMGPGPGERGGQIVLTAPPPICAMPTR
jgi:excinuclease ABC subunit A